MKNITKDLIENKNYVTEFLNIAIKARDEDTSVFIVNDTQYLTFDTNGPDRIEIREVSLLSDTIILIKVFEHYISSSDIDFMQPKCDRIAYILEEELGKLTRI